MDDASASGQVELFVASQTTGMEICKVCADRLWRPVDVKRVIEDLTGMKTIEQRLYIGSVELVDQHIGAALGEEPDMCFVDPRGQPQKLFRVGLKMRMKEQAYWLDKVSGFGLELRLAPEGMRDDREVVTRAIRTNYKALQFASDSLRSDLEVALLALSVNMRAVDFVGHELWDNKAFVMAALKLDGSLIERVDDRLHDDVEVILASLDHDWNAFAFASDRLRENRDVIFAACRHSLRPWDFVSKPTRKALLADPGFMEMVVKQDYRMLSQGTEQVINDHYVAVAAVSHDWRAYKFLGERAKGDHEVILAALQQDFCAISLAVQEIPVDREIIIKLVQKNWGVLSHVPPEHLCDVEVCQAAVEADWRSLQLMSEDMRGLKSIASAAIKQSCQALRFLSPPMRRDRAVVCEGVAQDGMLLELVSEDLRADEEVVRLAVEQNWRALRFASIDLQGNWDLVIGAVESDYHALEFASLLLLEQVDFMVEAVRINTNSLEFVTPTVLEDREFVLALANDANTPRRSILGMVTKNWKILGFLPRRFLREQDLVMAGVVQSWHVLELIDEVKKAAIDSDEPEHEKSTAIPNYWMNIEIMREAVKQDWHAMLKAHHSIWLEKDILLSAIAQDSAVLEAMPKGHKRALWGDRDIVLAAVKGNWRLITHIVGKLLWMDTDVILSALNQSLETMSLVPKELFKGVLSKREVALKMVQHDWNYLLKVDEKVWQDREVVLQAVKQNGKVLQRCPKECSRALWADLRIAKEVVRQDYTDLKQVEPALQCNEEVLLVAVSQDWKVLNQKESKIHKDAVVAAWKSKPVVGEILAQDGEQLEHVIDSFRNDPSLVLKAVNNAPLALRFAGIKPKADREVVLEAVKRDGMALRYADPSLRGDREVVEAAIRQNRSAKEFVSES